MNKQIEIEHRAWFSKVEYDWLLKLLQARAEDLGQDDKNVFFFLLPDKLLKVTDNVSQDDAKVTLKLNRIGEGSDFEELEYLIDRKAVDRTVELFRQLGLELVQKTTTRLHLFFLAQSAKKVEFRRRRHPKFGRKWFVVGQCSSLYLLPQHHFLLEF